MMKRLGLVILLSGIIASSTFASIVWNGPTGSWSDPSGWDKGIVPDDTEEIKITTDGTVCTVDSDIGIQYVNQRITAASGPSGATLEIVSGGKLEALKDLRSGGAGATSAGSLGYINQTGGQLIVKDFTVGRYASGKPTGEGYYTISGGSLAYTSTGRLFVGAGSNGGYCEGMVTVVGSNASIIMKELYVGSEDGIKAGKGTLEFQIDSGGVSPITVENAYLDLAGDNSTTALVLSLINAPPSGNILLVENIGTAAVSGIFDSLDGGSAAEGAAVTLSYGGTDYLYTLTYAGGVGGNDIMLIPEPATLLLFGLGSLIAIRRRKK
jgi:hypothetical protein